MGTLKTLEELEAEFADGKVRVFVNDTQIDGPSYPSKQELDADISAAETPIEAAAVCYNFFRKFAKYHEFGQPSLHSSGEAFGYGDTPCIIWEEGPHEWAVSISLGCGMMTTAAPEINLLSHDGWFAEPYNPFVLCFWEI